VETKADEEEEEVEDGMKRADAEELSARRKETEVLSFVIMETRRCKLVQGGCR
jgi:hypothetical protein